LRILSRLLVLVFAVALVGGAGCLRAETVVSGASSPIAVTAGWQQFDGGAFRILAPRETALRRENRLRGALVDRRFTLSYAVGSPVDTANAKAGRDYQERPVEVGGRRGVVRSAMFPDRSEPYFLQLVVPEAVQAKDGRWLSFEIHGWFTNTDRRWLAEHIVCSVDFTPPFDVPLQPVRPHVDPPTIEIDDPSGKDTP
jgi:hypothetical protein